MCLSLGHLIWVGGSIQEDSSVCGFEGFGDVCAIWNGIE